MSKDFGVIYAYVVPCAGCDVKMLVPNPLTDVCTGCSTFHGDEYDDYPLGQVRG